MLEVGYKGTKPWQFNVSDARFEAKLMFDETSVDWHDTQPQSTADILFDVCAFLPPMLADYSSYSRVDLSTTYYGDDIKLYSYRPINPTKYFCKCLGYTIIGY